MMRTILIRRDAQGIATLTLNRPDKHHAMDARMIGELTEAAALLGEDADVRAVVLGHTGPTFCAGADLSEAAGREPGDVAVDRAREMTRLLRAILELPVPVIAAVEAQLAK